MNITDKDQPHLTAILTAAEKYSDSLRSSMKFSSNPNDIEKWYQEYRELDEHIHEFHKIYGVVIH